MVALLRMAGREVAILRLVARVIPRAGGRIILLSPTLAPTAPLIREQEEEQGEVEVVDLVQAGLTPRPHRTRMMS